MDTPPTSIKVAILELTKDLFSKRKGPVPLAQIGLLLNKNYKHLKPELGGKKLYEFISSEMADAILVTRSPDDQLVFFASPKEHETGTASTNSSHQEKTRYQLAFWTAFAKQLPEDCVRTLQLEPKVSFSDISSSALHPTDSLIIDREFVLDHSKQQSKPDESREIALKIQKWLGSHPVDINLVTVKPKQQTSRALPLPPSTFQTSLLHALIGKLTPDELKRLSMPLDIIKKLLETGP